LALQFAHETLGIDPVPVTCDDDNIGSIKAIDWNGGVLENVITGRDRDKPTRRYWIRRVTSRQEAPTD
jgi:predicted acetyltransferase